MVTDYKDINSIFKVRLTIVDLLKRSGEKKSKSQYTSLGLLKAIISSWDIKKN